MNAYTCMSKIEQAVRDKIVLRPISFALTTKLIKAIYFTAFY